MSDIETSRRTWKEKAIRRGSELRELRKQCKRLNREVDKSRKRANSLHDDVVSMKRLIADLESIKRVPDKRQAVVICIQLFLVAKISLRSIPRVLQAMAWVGWVPSFSSVINWIGRLGLQKLDDARKLKGDWVAIVDMSIDIAFKKALVVLRVPLEIFDGRDQGLTLNDVSCVGLEVSQQWNGDSVSEALQRILGNGDGLKIIIKDNGRDLAKGVNLWREQHSAEHVFVVSDLGHEVANALKEEFTGMLKFKEITKTLKHCGTKIFQSRYACLAPPKLRTKGRFMGICRVARWFDKMRGAMGGPGRVHSASPAAELRRMMGGLASLHYPLDKLLKYSNLTAEIMKILKRKGLNQQSYRETRNLIHELPSKSVTRMRLMKWLNTHLAIQSRLSIGQTPLPVSSDVIESLFGTYKNFLARSSKPEFNHLILAIPAMCGHTSVDQIIESQKSVSHKRYTTWVESNIGTTSNKLRRSFLGKTSKQIIV
jgi:hypothetical protein